MQKVLRYSTRFIHQILNAFHLIDIKISQHIIIIAQKCWCLESTSSVIGQILLGPGFALMLIWSLGNCWWFCWWHHWWCHVIQKYLSFSPVIGPPNNLQSWSSSLPVYRELPGSSILQYYNITLLKYYNI